MSAGNKNPLYSWGYPDAGAAGRAGLAAKVPDYARNRMVVGIHLPTATWGYSWVWTEVCRELQAHYAWIKDARYRYNFSVGQWEQLITDPKTGAKKWVPTDTL